VKRLHALLLMPVLLLLLRPLLLLLPPKPLFTRPGKPNIHRLSPTPQDLTISTHPCHLLLLHPPLHAQHCFGHHTSSLHKQQGQGPGAEAAGNQEMSGGCGAGGGSHPAEDVRYSRISL